MKDYLAQSLEHQEFSRTEVRGVVEAMREALLKWAFLPFDYLGEPVEGPVRMHMEWSVLLSGTEPCFLNIRTLSELPAFLARHAPGYETGPDAPENALREFIHLFCGHLTAYLWGKQGTAFDSRLPVPTTPADWPSGEPSAACAFLVGNAPVEIRLWIKETSCEKN